MCVLIIFMIGALQPAFGLFDIGIVQSKNVVSAAFRKYISIGIMTFLMFVVQSSNVTNRSRTVIGSLAYFATGYALSFGGGNAFWGTEYFCLIGLPDDQLALVFFQYTFAATAATIPSGPVHERCNLVAYLCYTTLIAGIKMYLSN